MACSIDLTARRRNLGLSKAAMARRLRIGYASWCRAENGEPVSEATQKAIADDAGMKVTEAFPEPSEAAA
jgi:transcriptional regulator with XRE-family HTH domain